MRGCGAINNLVRSPTGLYCPKFCLYLPSITSDEMPIFSSKKFSTARSISRQGLHRILELEIVWLWSYS